MERSTTRRASPRTFTSSASMRSSSSAATALWRLRIELSKKGIPIVGVPKTIDNDIVGTVSCFGFDTAVELRDRRDRSAAHHGRGAPSRHGGRGDGALRRMDCAVCRRRGWRRRHPDSRDSVRSERSWPRGCASARSSGHGSASWSSQKAPCRLAARCRSSPKGMRRQRSGSAASARRARGSSSS